MHIHRTLGFLLSISMPLALVAAGQPGEELRARFEALDEKADHPAIVQLWREHARETLGVIDSYLEGSLAKLETSTHAEPAVIAAMEARALRGARAADEAFGTSIFSDYAASFASWSAEEQVRLRRGQALFGEASKALTAKDFEKALAKATESLGLARPLGDWWGSAMALGAMASAQMELGRPREALDCASQARLIDHDLRLARAEYSCLDVMVRAADQLGHGERARVSAEAGLALARQLEDEAGAAAWEKTLASLRARK